MIIFISGWFKKFSKKNKLKFLTNFLIFILFLSTNHSDFKNKISQMKRLDDATPGMETNGNHLGIIFRFFIFF